MTPRPTSGSFSDENYAILEPILNKDGIDEANDWHGAIYVAGVGIMYQDLHGLIRSPGAGQSAWSAMLDPDLITAENLPWLGQWVGVRINSVPVEPATAERLKVKTHAGFARGTRAAMLHDIQATLTGTKHVFIRERWNGPLDIAAAYHITIDTLASETPDPTATLSAILGQKPGGLVLHWNNIGGEVWDEATHTWDGADPTATWNNVNTHPV